MWMKLFSNKFSAIIKNLIYGFLKKLSSFLGGYHMNKFTHKVRVANWTENVRQ